MKRLNRILPALAAFLLLLSFCAHAQQPGGPDAPGGPRGSGQRGPFGPPLPAEQQAEVDRIMAALDTETKAVTAANSNLIAASFSTPVDKEKLTKLNEELSRSRAVWAAKASKLFAENQASEKKLSSEAVTRLVQLSSGGRGGRGFGPGGFGAPSGPGRRPAPGQ